MNPVRKMPLTNSWRLTTIDGMVLDKQYYLDIEFLGNEGVGSKYLKTKWSSMNVQYFTNITLQERPKRSKKDTIGLYRIPTIVEVQKGDLIRGQHPRRNPEKTIELVYRCLPEEEEEKLERQRIKLVTYEVTRWSELERQDVEEVVEELWRKVSKSHSELEDLIRKRIKEYFGEQKQ